MRHVRKAALNRIRNLEFQLHRAKIAVRGNRFSRLNEQQLLRRYIAEMLPKDHNRTIVDLGAGDGMRMSNSFALLVEGWACVGVEFDQLKVARLAAAYRFYNRGNISRCRITPGNVVPLLAAHSVPKDFSVLSLDIDSYDLLVLDSVLRSYRPQLIVTEINEKIPPPIRFYVKFDPDFSLRHHFYGYSIKTLEDLCRHHNYSIIDLEYNNAFLAPAELAADRALTAETAYRKGYLDRPDRREKFRPNENMECLHSMSGSEGIEFLNNFYRKDQGNYEISLDRTIGIGAHNGPNRPGNGNR